MSETMSSSYEAFCFVSSVFEKLILNNLRSLEPEVSLLKCQTARHWYLSRLHECSI